MHQRVTAWILGSCTAPAVFICTATTSIVMREGLGALLMALLWQVLLAFLLVTLSLALLSPLLLLPMERRALSAQWRTILMIAALIAAVGFVMALTIGGLVAAILLGLLLNAVVMLLIVPRPAHSIERSEPQAARPS